MGGVFTVSPLRIESPAETAALLRDRGYDVVATVVDPGAPSASDFPWRGKTALVLGGEHEGLDGPWLDVCSTRVTIPMCAGTDSLNVAAAAGICMFAYFSERRIALQ